MKRLALFVVALLIVGCSTEYVSVNGEKPPRYATDVQVARYETENRAPSARLEVFNSVDALRQRHYRIIALLTREGNREDEGLIMNAIAWRARQLGAEGIIPPGFIPSTGSTNGPQISVNTSVNIGFWNEGNKNIFRACAIVFTPETK